MSRVYIARAMNVTHRDDAGKHLVWMIEQLRHLGVDVIDPASMAPERAHFGERFRWCISNVLSSDRVILDAAAHLGLGAGAEAMLAFEREIEVWTICPQNSHYRQGSWIHPFVHGMSTAIFDTYAECLAAFRGENKCE